MEAKTRKNLVSAVITVAILVVAFALSRKMAAMRKSTVGEKPVVKERRKVVTQRFSPEEVANSIEIDGRLVAQDRISVTSKVQGVVRSGSRRLREGMYIQSGALLFDLDNTEAAFQLKAQKSALMTTITQMMPDLKFDYGASFEQWQNYLAGFDVDSPIQPLPTPLTEQERFFIAGRNIYNQYYTIKSLETRLADYMIYAPFSGVITSVNATPGALVSPGQALLTMINTGSFELEAPVELSALQYVKVGAPVTLTSEELDKSWQGKVARIGTTIDPATQYIPLYIRVQGRGLKDGIYLRGELKGQPLQDVISLPRAVFATPTTVLTVEDSTIVAKEVVPVKRSEEQVLVRGLSPDDQVVTGALAGLYEGQKVTF